MTRKIDVTRAIQIFDNLYWVGWPDFNAGFGNNPYLLVEDDIVVLFDPGSGHKKHWKVVKKKIEQIVPLKKVTTIIVHHQDPDLCGSIRFFEEEVGVDNFELLTSDRTAIFIPYYGIETEITSIQDGETFEIGNNHKLQFLTTPYLHFPGSINTYDMKNKILFSSDIFGALATDWSLYAGDNYLTGMRVFCEAYMASHEAVINYTAKIRKLDIEMICPQHGSIINEHIDYYIKALEDMEVGIWK